MATKNFTLPDIDDLAQHIRAINGNHTMGAGTLAERIIEWLASRPAAGSGISDASVQALGMALAKQHAVYLTTGSVRKLLEDALAMAPATTQAQEATHWIRVVDEELVGAHLGVADASDDYNTAKAKLNKLIAWHVAVATDPDVNGGLSLQPVAAAPTQADSAPGDEAQVLSHAEAGSGQGGDVGAAQIVYRWQALDYSGFCYGSNPPDDLPARCNLTAFYRQPEAFREALHEISATSNLTATPQQFARHLQKVATDALTGTFIPDPAEGNTAELRSALNAMLTYFGMDEDEFSKGTFDQARRALAARQKGNQPRTKE